MKSEIEFTEKDTTQENLWIVPYGNLMTLLMIFFLVLYAFTYLTGDANYENVISALQSASGGSQTAAKEMAAVNALKNYFYQHGMEGMTGITVNAEKIQMQFKVPILFQPSSAELTAPARGILSSMTPALKDLDNPILVEGHTDNSPVTGRRFKSNLELSAARAQAVVEFLAVREGVSPDRFIIRGYGDKHPLYPNDTPDHCALNRRIELSILRDALVKSNPISPKLIQMQDIYYQAMYYYNQKDYDNAEKCFKNILALDSQHPQSRRLLKKIKTLKM